MCFKKLSHLMTLNKCCCGIPLKTAVYMAGISILIYCSYIEIGGLQTIFNIDYFDYDYINESLSVGVVPALAIGSGVGIVDHTMRRYSNFEMSPEYIINFVRGLIIAWTVINALLMISTFLMIYGTAKDRAMLLLQWLVISATIAIGNLIDVLFAIVYMHKSFGRVNFPSGRGTILNIVQCLLESVGIAYAFVVVRSYYCHVTLPSIPVSFKTLESQESQDEQEENEKTYHSLA